MKNIIMLVLPIIVFSCSKGNDQPVNPIGGNIAYKLNGTTYSFSNGLIKKVAGTPGATSTTYLIQGFDNSNNSANIFIATHSDTLRDQLYHLVYGSEPDFTSNNKAYTVLDTPDYFVDVTISSYTGGKVSGTITGKVMHIVSVNPQVVEDAEITEGHFENLPVEYH
jgi:hypothetical protein